MQTHSDTSYRFGQFEVNAASGELFKNGKRVRLQEQPFRLLIVLLENAGEVVTREDLRSRIWPEDTFVDFDGSLRVAVRKLRDALGDDSESPRYIETIPKRGYRFLEPAVRPAEASPPAETPPISAAAVGAVAVPKGPSAKRGVFGLTGSRRTLTIFAACCLCVLLAGAGWLAYRKWRTNAPAQPVQRPLTRLTSDEGLQTGATWSPDGRYIAYASDRGGKYDIWVQQISGGDPIQITKGPGQNWQPDWSPDGKYIAYRSEEGEGGIYITPSLGGAGLQRKIASFGYYPRWSPDSSRILLQPAYGLFVVGLNGDPPREVMTDLPQNSISTFSAWHPDGKRITAWIFDNTENPVTGSDSPIPHFSTEPVDGGRAIESRFPPSLQKQIEALEVAPGFPEWRMDFRFAWAPSGKALFFERSFRGARNLWRMTVDPATLQPTNVERLTTSAGLDAELSVSRDGTRLAFTSERQQIRAWALPFDANHGRVTGSGEPVTSPGIEAWALDLSRDGKKLSVWGDRDGKAGVWETSVPNGREQPFVASDSYFRTHPVWSPDGKRAAYARVKDVKVNQVGESQLVVWSSDTRTEDPVEALGSPFEDVYDWSPDGKSVLVTHFKDSSPSIWQIFVDPALSGKSSARKIISDPNHGIYQANFSPDGKWIAFNATSPSSTIYAIPATGGPWIRITDGKQWDDKPRWSPDGRTIYYLSERRGFFNLWGVPFDPMKGKPQGEPFQVTSFETPALMIPKKMEVIDISLAKDRLVLPLAQTSGNIWILDDVDR